MAIRIAHIDQDGIVVNISVANTLPESDGTMIPSSNAAIGQVYQNGQFITPPPKPLTEDEFIATVQQHLDAEAKTHGYDNILSLCTYATSTDPTYAAEGQAGINWRDAVWQACFTLLADVTANTRPMPTDESFLEEFPVMEWA